MTMERHADRTITIQLSAEEDDLRLDDFLEQMAPLKAALRETERLVAGGEPTLYFRIKQLQKNSPAKVILEAVSDEEGERSRPQYASYVVRSLTTNLRVILNKKRLPAKIDVPALDSYRDLAAPSEKRHLEVQLQCGDHTVTVGRQFREILDSIVGEDEFSYGSVSGKIEAINLHDRNRRVLIFPIIGASRVVGTFRNRDRKLFAGAVDKYVTVHGRLRYKTWDKHPYEINADGLTVHDMESSPTLEDMKGISPEATGSLTTQEYIDNLRDEW
jgi:hypothetical protein